MLEGGLVVRDADAAAVVEGGDVGAVLVLPGADEAVGEVTVSDRVSACELRKNFGRYQDRALVTPVTVTKYGRPSVVIVSAAEYERLKKLDRQALAVSELGERDITAIKAARIPAKHRYG